MRREARDQGSYKNARHQAESNRRKAANYWLQAGHGELQNGGSKLLATRGQWRAIKGGRAASYDGAGARGDRGSYRRASSGQRATGG